jgi:UPF0271 protein
MNEINLNADMAEGWGAYQIGNDDALAPIVRSASLACGFHGGDWNTMYRMCEVARRTGLSIGAHPAFNDVWGFGRRAMRMSEAEIERMVAYQIGALQAVAGLAGMTVTHLKPHGALSNMAAVEIGYARAIGKAIAACDKRMIYVAQAATEMERAAKELGLPLAREGFADRQYEENLTLSPRSTPGAVIHEPRLAAEQAVRMATRGEVVARTGKVAKVEVDTICIHGDEPTAVAVGTAVRQSLEAAGVKVLPLPELAHLKGN